MPQVVLVSNGPGELYTWVKPVMTELRRKHPNVSVSICLIPCQFAGGNEASIAATFQPDALSTPNQYARAAAVGSAPEPVAQLAGRIRQSSGGTDNAGAVIGLGGNGAMAVALGKRLGYPSFRYSFEPNWIGGLQGLLVPDENVRRRATRAGAPSARVSMVGNLVADAVDASTPLQHSGKPHVLLFGGSRDGFALHLIPLMIAVTDLLSQKLPEGRFIWPVSRLLKNETLAAGIAGQFSGTLGGASGARQGDVVLTPSGARLELVNEQDRYAHMRSADLAITIPGTNTLELGIAGVPALVLLPMNRPELIPLEGPGHWLGLVPLVGKYLKRYAVKLFVEGLNVPVSLPNRIAGEELMVELRGRVQPSTVADRALALLGDPQDLERRRNRLGVTMPKPGAAAALVNHVFEHAGLSAEPAEDTRVGA